MFKHKNKQTDIKKKTQKKELDKKNDQTFYSEEITEEQIKNSKKSPKSKNKLTTFRKKNLLLGIPAGALFLSIIVGVLFLTFHKKPENIEEAKQNLTEIEGKPVYYYDNLTGKPIARSGTQYDNAGNKITDESGKIKKLTIKQAETIANEINSQPTFCVQIPNGMDGARPQVGLNRASIVFEAIAEAGITRFAAIFKNPVNQQAIGPIRSLRLYHLDWDSPFDCTIIHAGGADDALSTVNSGYKHLSESVTYMWRNYGRWSGSRFLGYVSPNNLFTSGPLLLKYHADREQNTRSYPKPFDRLTTEEADSQKSLVGKTTNSDEKTDASANQQNTSKPQEPSLPKINNIHIRFNYQAGFNVNYNYNPSTNTYFRSFASGEAHTSYTCENTKSNPSPKRDCGEPTQINPDTVIVIRVKEQTSLLDHYHEDITTIGSGKAYVFQNGTVFEGTWQKNDRMSQLTFKNNQGETIKLKPGQTWISAIPDSYGKISYE